MIKKTKNLYIIFNKILKSFTLTKLISALITITLITIIKYIIYGNIFINHDMIFYNIGIGLLG